MEGYWLTHFETAESRGDGISILHDGELLGGDLEHLWSGSYEEDGTHVSARIRIVPVVAWPEEELIAREPPIILSLAGQFTDDFARLGGNAEHKKDLHFDITLRKCREALAAKSHPEATAETTVPQGANR